MSKPKGIAKTLRPKDRKKLKGLVAAAMKAKRNKKAANFSMKATTKR